MAYGQALNADDEQKQKALMQNFAPTSLGGAPTQAGGAAPQQQQSQAGSGTGFVNLQGYLDNASNDRAGDLTKTSTATLGTEQKRFDDAAKPITDATNAIAPAPNSTDIASAFKAASGQNGQTVQAPTAPAPGPTMVAGNTGVVSPRQMGGEGGPMQPVQRPGATVGAPVQVAGSPFVVGGAPPPMSSSRGFDLLNGWLNGDYKGPMSVDYTPDDANAKKLVQNSDARSALEGTYGDRMKAGPYSLGDEMLDQSLFQGDAGVHKAADATKQSVEAFDKDTAKRSTDLAGKAQKAVDDTRNTRDLTRATLGEIANRTGGQIDARVKARNDQESNDRQSGIIRDPNTGAVVSAPNGQVAGEWEAGTGANRANTANDAERAQYAQLSKLLGIDDIGPKGDYVSGRTTTHTVPGQLKTTPMSNDQRDLYQRYINAGYTDQQAMDAAMSMQRRGAPIFEAPPPVQTASTPPAPSGNFKSPRR